jgi:hypothetical protein
MPKQLNFDADWRRLGYLPFHRREKSGDLFKRVYRVMETYTDHPDYEWMWLVKELLLLPYSLWRVPYDGMAKHICDLIESGKRFDAHLILLLELLDDLPSKEEQRVIIKFERFIQKGDYSWLVPGSSKFDAQEKELLADVVYKYFWTRIKEAYNVDEHRDRYGILRRTPAQERNYHPKDWSDFHWEDEEYRFQTTFDAFANRWVLYGVEGEHPLLQKLTFNPTAIGWIGYWPKFWSNDKKRDLNWKEVNDAQKARGVKRLGPKLSAIRRESRRIAKAAHAADLEAVDAGWQGDERRDHIIKKAGLNPDIDDGSLRRLLRRGKKFTDEDNKAAQLTGKAQIPKVEPGTAKVEPSASPSNLKPAPAATSTSNQERQTSNFSKVNLLLAGFATLSPEEKQVFLESATNQ